MYSLILMAGGFFFEILRILKSIIMFDTSFGLKTWIYPGLFWGVFMYLGLTILLPVMDGEIITWEKVYTLLTGKKLYTLPIWLIVGLVLQYMMFKHIYKKGRREIGEKTD